MFAKFRCRSPASLVFGAQIPLPTSPSNRAKALVAMIVSTLRGSFQGRERIFSLPSGSGGVLREALMTSFELRRWRLACVGSLFAALFVFTTTSSQAADTAPSGQAVMAWHVTIA